jgi:hypothetical protein
MSSRILSAAVVAATLCGCAQQPPSPQGDLAEGVAKLANMRGRTSGQVVESTLRLSQNGLVLKYPTEWRYVVKATDLVRFDAIRVDTTIKSVLVDNVNHGHGGGALQEQEIRLDLPEGTCLTADLMRNATGVAPVPSKDLATLPPHYPDHYYRAPIYDLEFVVRDSPLDRRKILLGGKPPCYRVVVVMKHFKDD